VFRRRPRGTKIQKFADRRNDRERESSRARVKSFKPIRLRGMPSELELDHTHVPRRQPVGRRHLSQRCGTKLELFCFKRDPYGLRMNEQTAVALTPFSHFFATEATYKSLSFNNKHTEPFLFQRGLARLGTNADSRTAKVDTPKNKKNAFAGESGSQRPNRRKDKLIRLMT
jgi:hypothetical protein